MADIACPNYSSKEWKLLEDAVGERKAMDIYYMNGGTLPSEDKIPAWTERYKTQEAQVDELDKSEAIEDILNNLDNPNVEKDSNQEGYTNTKTGEKVSQRVSDLAQQYAIKHNIHYKGEDNDWFGKKGTVLHRYMEELGKAIADGRDPTIGEIQEEVFKLRELDLFSDDPEQFFRITPKQFKLLKKGMQDLMDSIKEIQRVKVDPEGEVQFRFETSVLDDARSLAGTIDMVAIFSDGTAGVYDFKSYTRAGRRPPGQQKVEKWNVQMANYKNILKDFYGIKNFRQSRAIPIHVSYSQNDQGEYINEVNRGFKTLAIQNNENTEKFEHLDPIPLEELTGDKNLDKLIRRLINEKIQTEKLFDRAKTKDKSRLLNKLSRINNALKNIQLNRDVLGMINDVANLYENYGDRLKLSKTHDNYLTDWELLDAIGEMNMYSTLVEDYGDQLTHLDKKKRKQVKERLEQAQARVLDMRKRLLEEAEVRVGEEVTQPGEHIGFLARNFTGLQNFTGIPVFKKLHDLIRDANERKRRATKQEFEVIDDLHEKFVEWADNNGYKGTSRFDVIYDENTGQLHRKYSNEFWEKRFDIMNKAREGEKISKEDKDWMRKHFNFNRERYEELRDLQIGNIEKDLANDRITENQAQIRKERFYNFNSIEADPDNFFRTSFLVPDEETSQEYLSDEWKFIQQNEPVKEYYDLLVDYNKRWTEELGHDTINNQFFVPNVKNSVLDQVFEHGMTGAKDFWSALQRQHQIHQQDELQGVRDTNGNPLSEIPVLYTDPVRAPIGKDAEERIREAVENDTEILYERGTEEFEKEVQRRVREAEKEKGLSLKSKDIHQSFKAMIYSVNNYRHMSSIEADAQMLQALIKHDRIESFEITEQDKPMIRDLMGDVVKKIGLDPSLEEAFQDFMDMLIYGKQLKTDKIFEWDGQEYSRNKLVRSAMNFLSVRALGLNTTIQMADFIQGRTSLRMKAREGIYFDTSGYKNVVSDFASRDDQFKRVVEFWEPDTRDLRAEEIELSGANVLSRRATQRTLFIGYAWSDENINNTILAAMARNYRVDSDGKIKNPKTTELIDSDAPTVYESVKENEDGKLVIENLTLEEFAKFRDKVHKQANKIRGSTNERQKSLMNMTLLGQSLMQFKSWIPGLAEDRFGKLKYDQTMEEFEQGRFSVAFGEIIGNGFLPTIKEITKLSTEVISMGLYKKNINQDAVDRYYEKFLEENPQYRTEEGQTPKFTKEQFIRLRRAKLNGFVSEARVYLGFFLLVHLLGGLEWDDEKEGNIFTWEAHNLVRRALLEASFWWSPKTVDDIIKSPIAMLGMLQEIEDIYSNAIVETSYAIKGERDPRDETPFGYYILKNTPGVNQVLDISGFLQEYNPPRSAWEKAFDIGEEDNE